LLLALSPASTGRLEVAVAVGAVDHFIEFLLADGASFGERFKVRVFTAALLLVMVRFIVAGGRL
jgi:hypothetical protein